MFHESEVMMDLPCGITKYNKKANLKQIPQSKALAVASYTIKI
ncbi:hypothetical protein [uncultured Campylobacter sp.]|nr:hypothetical protein [uncultured Campylobacter sp.]